MKMKVRRDKTWSFVYAMKRITNYMILTEDRESKVNVEKPIKILVGKLT